jgi:hypothetical protein
VLKFQRLLLICFHVLRLVGSILNSSPAYLPAFLDSIETGRVERLTSGFAIDLDRGDPVPAPTPTPDIKTALPHIPQRICKLCRSSIADCVLCIGSYANGYQGASFSVQRIEVISLCAQSLEQRG